MATKTTWQPHTEHGELATRDRRELPDSAYVAFVQVGGERQPRRPFKQ